MTGFGKFGLKAFFGERGFGNESQRGKAEPNFKKKSRDVRAEHFPVGRGGNAWEGTYIHCLI